MHRFVWHIRLELWNNSENFINNVDFNPEHSTVLAAHSQLVESISIMAQFCWKRPNLLTLSKLDQAKDWTLQSSVTKMSTFPFPLAVGRSTHCIPIAWACGDLYRSRGRGRYGDQTCRFRRIRGEDPAGTGRFSLYLQTSVFQATHGTFHSLLATQVNLIECLLPGWVPTLWISVTLNGFCFIFFTPVEAGCSRQMKAVNDMSLAFKVYFQMVRRRCSPRPR